MTKAEAVAEIREHLDRIKVCSSLEAQRRAPYIERALTDLIGDEWHKFHVGPKGWSLEHPLLCPARDDGGLHTCEVHTAVEAFVRDHETIGNPPIAPGEYPIHELADVADLDKYLP